MRSIKITDLKYDNYNIEVFINYKNVYKPQGYTKEINIKNIIYNENDDIKIVITLILVIIFCVIQGFIFKPIRLVKKYI